MPLTLDSLGGLRLNTGGAVPRQHEPDGVAAIDFGAVLLMLAAGVSAPVLPPTDLVSATPKDPHASLESGESLEMPAAELVTKAAAQLAVPALAVTTMPLAVGIEAPVVEPVEDSVAPLALQESSKSVLAVEPVITIPIAMAAAAIPADTPKAQRESAPTPKPMQLPAPPAPDAPPSVNPSSAKLAVASPEAPAAASLLSSAPAALEAIVTSEATPIAEAAESSPRTIPAEINAAISFADVAAEAPIERPAVRLREDARPVAKLVDGRTAVTKFDRVAETITVEAVPQTRVVPPAAASQIHHETEPATHALPPAVRAESLASALVADETPASPALRSQLIETMRMQIREGGGHAEIRLHPEFLGGLKISVVVDHGSVKATVLAETAAGLEHVQRHVDGLREALAERGLRLDEFEVAEDPRAGQFRSGDEHESPNQRDEPRRPPRTATRPAPRGGEFAEVFDVVA